MTAVVGILNKQGVAIAADSAVTVANMQKRKVYNSANKLFTVSKYHPVGVAIYNNAQFMGVPWEILIKEFRKQLRRASFDTLEQYIYNFLAWLKTQNYINVKSNNEYLFYDFLSFVQAILNETEPTDLENVIQYLEEYLEKEIPQHQIIESLKNIDIDNLANTIKSLLPDINKVAFPELKQENDKLNELLVNSYSQYLLHDQFLQFSGLIFVGFGEQEIFPKLIPVNISIVVEGEIRYHIDIDRTGKIDHINDACIRPFAQTDVIDTILQGISPELNHLSANVFYSFINQFLDEIKSKGGVTEQVKDLLNTLNTNHLVTKYQEAFSNIIQQKYVYPLLNAVSQLSKEDLAEMAESLVYLTYLKRRFTMAEESVGGPVDIAVITKGDGFIWIKRKHYFDPQLNYSFFQKYL